MRRAAVFLLCACLAAPVAAQVPRLDWPVDCDLGTTCYIEDYLDRDPSEARRDYACGLNTRDAHGGTDIALLSFEAMARGVAVLAAAPGTVLGVRDGVADLGDPTADPARACGNGVRIDHGDGWHTQYCHLRQGSIRVRPGQTVSAGTPLGEVGLSGQTNHPHLHLSLEKDGQDVDPFAPDASQPCTVAQDSLWTLPVPYYDTGFYTASFSDHVPAYGDVQSGAARREVLSPSDPLVLYGFFYLAQPGDVLAFSARGPEGAIFAADVPLDAPKKSQMQAYGRRAPAVGWPRGDYDGTVRLMRGETLIALRHAHVTVQ
jgi:murein DD-endopeptidase MepM/ murein hydrolase activator NlpD